MKESEKFAERPQMKKYRKILKAALYLLFPPRCPVCDGIVAEQGEKICLSCLPKLRYISTPRCLRCGKGLLEEEKEYCRDCTTRHHHYQQGRALYEYPCVAKSIYRFKYQGRREYAEFFGQELAEYLGDFIREIQPDGLIPVPLHRKRLRQRGYNQAQDLANVLGRCMGVPVYGKLLKRVKNTKPLKQLNPKERQNNLKNAFIMAQNDVKLKTIILIDDIYTTGSTVDEAARVLLEHGVGKVYFVALACGAGS